MAHISIQNLSVEFTIFGAKARSLKNTIVDHATGGRVMAGASDTVKVRAIDNLNFEIADGDRIGLVGHNGSGKTTLLRVIAGIYKPVAGRVVINGRVGTLLDPAAGMDYEATGLENIFLRGYLLGLRKREIAAQIDDIAEFTDLGDFLSLPMKTYSAGMRARLVFAIATAMRNDILLIDEGIGAGDAAFQQKVRQRIETLFARTPIVLIATHAEELISRLCNRQVRFEHGRLIEDISVEPPAVPSDDVRHEQLHAPG